jgi:predicted  nucleic acid-binding Zn-ribbon protein
MIEEEIVAEREVLAKKEKRLLETQTNKEYTAVQHEIESAREKIDRLETENLERMTDQDTLQPELDELRETLETKSKENTALIKELQEKYDSIETDIATLASSRDATLRKVDQRYLSVYTRLRKGRSGVAIAPVDKRKLSCSGCFKQLPPQKVVEVRRGQRMIFCESCGKILVWDDREGQD